MLAAVAMTLAAQATLSWYDGTTYTWHYWDMQDGTVEIAWVSPDPTGYLLIPDEIDGKPVSVIGGGAFSACGLTQVVIPEGVTRIGNSAFSNCTSLQYVQVPASVVSIGAGAFLYCLSLESVFFANDSALTYIEDAAFGTCKSLRNVKVPDSVTMIEDYAFEECTAMEYASLPARFAGSIDESSPIFDNHSSSFGVFFRETVGDIEWSYRIVSGEATVTSCSSGFSAISQFTEGEVVVPPRAWRLPRDVHRGLCVLRLHRGYGNHVAGRHL